MKKFILSVLILFLFINSNAQDRAQKIDELVSKYAEIGVFNGSVLVGENGNVFFEKGYGYADREQKLQNTPETKFRIASLTKQFTAMLIMQLVEQGKIKLDAKLSDYLTYYRKDNGDKITIHNLLTHTSGVPNYTNTEFMENHLTKSISAKDLILTYGNGDLEFEPGSEYKYSNTGYVMLGAVIEKVTGKTYETVLQENILAPLEMTNSGYEHNDAKMTNQAIGYDNAFGSVDVSKYIDMTIPFSAGAMYSTIEDMYKWDRALYTGKLLSAEMKAKMFTPFLKNYAYGWNVVTAKVSPTDEKIIYTHSGGINGFNTNIIRVESDNLVIIVLSNYSNGQASKISNDISKIMYGIPVKLPAKSVTNVLISSGSKTIKEAIAEARELAKNKDEYIVNEGEINNLGYQMMQSGKTDDAIEIFKFNVEMFPNSANVYDSLGEAYLAKGDKENALINYKKSVELDPKSTSGLEALKKLEGK
ncbi:MAG: serine hydrolase [Ignavibacteria bacterium]|nr:serine hydrolase [Ignavibacteria bacterium]